MSKIKIASVSYLNSIPFIYGINESKSIDAELITAPPVECTRLFDEGEVDIALIPVAALPNLRRKAEIVTSHCIGSVGAVRTVTLMSDDEPHNIKRIWLDTDSQTSVKLLAHLCDNHFKIAPRWSLLTSPERLSHPEDGDAFLLIGDKVFDHEGEFEYEIDLAEEWMHHCSLPFVFAVWCCGEDVDREVLADLEDALEWGVEHTFEALQQMRPDVEMEDGYRYLTQNIDTLLDGAKREAMRRFLDSPSSISLK
ncbi:MAG: menaquinone biosynthesis protein [Rikenellaceae bacterium]